MSTRVIIGIVLLLLAGYGLVKGLPLLSGPAIELSSPTPYAKVEGDTLLLEGTAKRTETLYLNGGVLLIDETGHFITELTLPSGGSILSLTAHDRFGRNVTRQVPVFVP